MYQIVLFFTLLCIFFTGCDKRYYHNFYVKNNCDQPVQLKYQSGGSKDSVIIMENKKICISEYSRFDTKLQKISAITVFVTMEAYKNSVKSNINYLDNDLWTCTEQSDDTAEYCVEVNPTDFDQIIIE